VASEPDGAAPTTVALAEDGRALQAVVVGTEASQATCVAADELADYLQRISGATFEVRTGDGTTGLAVGVSGDFPQVDHGAPLQPEQPFRRDDYLLRTHPNGAYLIGAGESGVALAVWDFLHRRRSRPAPPTCCCRARWVAADAPR